MKIEMLSCHLANAVSNAVCVETEGADPQSFHISDIRRIAAGVIEELLSEIGAAERLEILSEMPDWHDAIPEMRTMRFSLGDYVAETIRSDLARRLELLVQREAIDHYDGRLLEILAGAGEIAAELIEGPARRFIERGGLGEYQAALGAMLEQGEVPPEALLGSMLYRACNFFSPLDTCLEDPEWGEPVGISEETVGRSAAEMRSWFGMLADLQTMHAWRPEEFRQRLCTELTFQPLGP